MKPFGGGKAFTLIELLIVIAIILILIGIALPNFLEAQMRAKVVAFRGDARTIAIAEESYFLDHKTYTNDGIYLAYVQLTSPIKYLSSIPSDPFGDFRNQSGNLIPGNKAYTIGTGNVKIPFSDTIDFQRDIFIIVGAGPDDMDSSGSINFFPHPPEDGPKFISYSPTNGTSSVGDLYKAGGSALPMSHRPYIQNF